MKGEINPDHIPLSKYIFQVVGLVPLTAVTLSGIEDELETTVLPDRTVASGGNRKATEFVMAIPMHHRIEQLAMEGWYLESQDPVNSPVYKKPCTLTMQTVSGTAAANFSLGGVFPMKRKLPDLDKLSEGEIALVEWTMSADDILPL